MLYFLYFLIDLIRFAMLRDNKNYVTAVMTNISVAFKGQLRQHILYYAWLLFIITIKVITCTLIVAKEFNTPWG